MTAEQEVKQPMTEQYRKAIGRKRGY